eukprot:CAMPEP_0174881928 /NCGR_PEP_ID=MMETSP1114-20130205/84499_1 /TAXON_ID=312471 /ORGANISM="Neobodo designis, Strain CCAP 1951/1" /LENGTH=360 /DNA_ID=CAMNT_0016117325 /DNA_START=29 /DNA_END=1108 /DNA_ORIENTATION=+
MNQLCADARRTAAIVCIVALLHATGAVVAACVMPQHYLYANASSSCPAYAACDVTFCRCVGAVPGATNATTCFATATPQPTCDTLRACLLSYHACLFQLQQHRGNASSPCRDLGFAVYAGWAAAAPHGYTGSTMHESCRFRTCEVTAPLMFECDFSNRVDVCNFEAFEFRLVPPPLTCTAATPQSSSSSRWSAPSSVWRFFPPPCCGSCSASSVVVKTPKLRPARRHPSSPTSDVHGSDTTVIVIVSVVGAIVGVAFLSAAVLWIVWCFVGRGHNPEVEAGTAPPVVADVVPAVTPGRTQPYGDAATAVVVVGEPVLHVPQRDYVGQYPPPAPSASSPAAAGNVTPPPRFGYDAAPVEMR